MDRLSLGCDWSRRTSLSGSRPAAGQPSSCLAGKVPQGPRLRADQEGYCGQDARVGQIKRDVRHPSDLYAQGDLRQQKDKHQGRQRNRQELRRVQEDALRQVSRRSRPSCVLCLKW